LRERISPGGPVRGRQTGKDERGDGQQHRVKRRIPLAVALQATPGKRERAGKYSASCA